MPGPSDAHLTLRPLAALQAGVVTREQALGHGVSNRTVARLVRQSHWRRLDPGVFLTSDTEPTFAARAWAGVLIAGDGSRLGGLAAARLQGLNDEDPAAVTVFVPHGRKVAARPGWEFLQSTSSGGSSGAPPCTRVEDTVLDLCATARPEDVVGWVTTAVQRGRTTPRRLLRVLAARRRHPHRALLVGLLAEVAVGAQSPLEVTYLRDVERPHGLPPGQRQRGSADRRAERDVWYLELGVVVELDGRLGHTGLGRFRDMSRDNDAGLTGLLTLRYGAQDLHGRPCVVAWQVGRALRQRGWTGLPVRCPRCRDASEHDLSW